MNYLAHGCRFLGDAARLAGTALPDWLNVLARRTRVRQARALEFVDHASPFVRRLAAGVVDHHRDDDEFHRSAAFAELNWRFAAAVRDATADPTGMRPMFVGHVLIEVLLDAELERRRPGLIDAYYGALGELDGDELDQGVNLLTPRPVAGVAVWLDRFLAEKFLYDYLSDAKLLFRLNQVMRRVGLPELPVATLDIFPQARQAVEERADLLVAFRPDMLT
ncbi:MAG: hypothetical protein U0795_16705 [Pirellulales bacterium]